MNEVKEENFKYSASINCFNIGKYLWLWGPKLEPLHWA